MSVLRKPETLFTKHLVRGAITGVLLAVVVLSACTSVSMRSPQDVKSLAGTYHGSAVASCCPPSFLFETLVIHEDGSYELSGRVNDKGTIKTEGNYIKVGPFTLWVHERGKQPVLQGTGLGTPITFGRQR